MQQNDICHHTPTLLFTENSEEFLPTTTSEVTNFSGNGCFGLFWSPDRQMKQLRVLTGIFLLLKIPLPEIAGNRYV